MLIISGTTLFDFFSFIIADTRYPRYTKTIQKIGNSRQALTHENIFKRYTHAGAW